MKKIPPVLLPLTLARVIGLWATSIWYDEAFSIFAARQPLSKMLQLLSLDYILPLWELIIHPIAWGPLWLVRLPALLFSIGAAWLAWEIAGHKQPILFTAMALLPGLLWHAQDARCYALLSFLYLLAAWFAIKGRWLGLTAACGLLLWTHATGAAYVAGALALALFHHRSSWKKILLVGGLAFISFLPWLPKWLQNDLAGHWIPPLSLVWFLNQLGYAFWIGTELTNSFLVLFTIILLFSLLFAFIRIKHSIQTAVLFLVPLLIILLISIFVRDVIVYRVLVPLLLPLGLWIAEASESEKPLHLLITPAWILLVLISLLTWNPVVRGAGLQQAAENIEQNWQDGDLIYYATGTTALPFSYYLPDFPSLIMVGEQHPAQGKMEILEEYGFHQAELSNLEYSRLWLIYPLDPLLSDEQEDWLEKIAKEGLLIDSLEYIQASRINVVLLEK